MYVGLSTDRVLFIGNALSNKNVYLLYDGGHYNIITNLKARMATRDTWRGNKGNGLILLLISGHVDDKAEGTALTLGLPSTITQSFIHVHRLVWP